MSKPRFRWWGYMRQVVRAYPVLCKVKRLSSGDLADREAVAKAIEETAKLRNGQERLGVMESLYWIDEPQKMDVAAARHFVSESTAIKWHGHFIKLVALHRGLTDAAEIGGVDE